MTSFSATSPWNFTSSWKLWIMQKVMLVNFKPKLYVWVAIVFRTFSESLIMFSLLKKKRKNACWKDSDQVVGILLVYVWTWKIETSFIKGWKSVLRTVWKRRYTISRNPALSKFRYYWILGGPNPWGTARPQRPPHCQQNRRIRPLEIYEQIMLIEQQNNVSKRDLKPNNILNDFLLTLNFDSSFGSRPWQGPI